MTKFSLSTYLTMSVLIILSGILWILFSQMDRNYTYPAISSDLQKEQSEIIQRVYQLQPEVKNEVLSITPKTTPVKLAVKPVSKPQNKQSEVLQTVLQNKQYDDVRDTFSGSEYESYYYLRNNPWSPDYKPGQ